MPQIADRTRNTPTRPAHPRAPAANDVVPSGSTAQKFDPVERDSPVATTRHKPLDLGFAPPLAHDLNRCNFPMATIPGGRESMVTVATKCPKCGCHDFASPREVTLMRISRVLNAAISAPSNKPSTPRLPNRRFGMTQKKEPRESHQIVIPHDSANDRGGAKPISAAPDSARPRISPKWLREAGAGYRGNTRG
jgi:hypothetical protein